MFALAVAVAVAAGAVPGAGEPPVVADEREVMLFRPAAGGFALDDARLTDAVRVYTRGVAWGERGAATAARLTLWYEGHLEADGEVMVTLYVLPPGEEARG